MATHGWSNTKEYHSWEKMKDRCLNPKSKVFAGWGGRGIKVCERWMAFENFISDMGPCPDGFSIDRINNDGDYEPGNCRWASRLDQMNNRGCCRRIEYQGRTQTLMQWARELGFKYTTLSRRALVHGEVPPRLFRPIHT